MSDNGTNGLVARTCGACLHWARMPANRMNLADVRGECRRHPPQVTVVYGQGPGGEVVTLGQACQNPQLPDKYPACGEFTMRLPQIVGS